MGKVDKNTLKKWFKRGAKPNEDQFESLIDSMMHKDEGIALEQMPELIEALDEKAPAEHGHGNYLDKTNPNLEEGEAEVLKKALNIKDGAEVIDEIVPEEIDKAVNSQAVMKWSIQKINTISDLRNTVGKEEGQIVELLGYYNPGDKPSLKYKWTSIQGVDDGGSVINSDSGSWIVKFGEVVNFRDFGCKCDGVTNDNLQIQSLKSFCYDKNYKVVLNANDHLVSTEDIDLYRIRKIDLRGTITLSAEKYLIIGSRHVITAPDTIFINIVNGIVKVQGCKNLNITLNRATKLFLWADGVSGSTYASMAYCNFFLGYVDNIEINSQNSGWINENNFYVARVKNLTINSLDNSYLHNGNKFYGATLETSNVFIDNASTNILFNSRLEGDNSIVFGTRAWGNKIIKHWDSFRSETYRNTIENKGYTDNGYNNQILQLSKIWQTNRDIYEINSNSDNYNINIINKRDDGKLNAISNGRLFETDLIEVRNPFGIEILPKGESSAFLRGLVTLYDENKIKLTSKPTDTYAVDAIGISWDSNNNRYSFNADRNSIGISIGLPIEFKYAKIEVFSNNSAITFDSINVILKHQINRIQPIKILSETKKLVSNIKPTNVNYGVNTFVRNIGSNTDLLGWIYDGSTWKDVSVFNKSASVTNITTADATDLATALSLVNELKAKLNAKLTADRNSGQQAIQ